MEVTLTWRNLLDWITGIIMVLYIIFGILTQILFVVIVQFELWQQVVTVLPFFISVGYVLWRVYEKGRKRTQQ